MPDVAATSSNEDHLKPQPEAAIVCAAPIRLPLVFRQMVTGRLT